MAILPGGNQKREYTARANNIPVSGPGSWLNLGVYTIPRHVGTPGVSVAMEAVLV